MEKYTTKSGIDLFGVICLAKHYMIFSQLRDPDRTKWGDLSYEIDWNYDQLKNLMAFRLSRSWDAEGKIWPFEDAWTKLFVPQPIQRRRDKKGISLHSKISSCTHQRPRDFIRYIRECASYVLDKRIPIATPDIVQRVEKKYSTYFRSELEDEIQGIIPEIHEMLNILALLGKPAFSEKHFVEAYNHFIRIKGLPKRDPQFVLSVLFDFSIIGYYNPNQRPIFKYLYKDAQCNFKASLLVHRGLLSSLQLL